jgi:hypothetical protein
MALLIPSTSTNGTTPSVSGSPPVS